MSTSKEKLFDVVRLKDGREGAIVHISKNGNKIAYGMDIEGGDPDIEFVTPDQVEKVIWSYPAKK